MGNLIARIAPNSDLSVDLWPPPPDFDVETDMPDLTGKVAIVTGSNSGIGYHVALRLLRKKARVYVAVRDSEKTRRALTRLEDATFGDIRFLELDLNDLVSVKRAAERFLSKEQRLDILVNNGGIMHPPAAQLTVQSLDASFGTNVASHYLFTKLLLPALSASHAATNTPSRVIFCASSTHTRAPGVQFDSLKGGPKRDAWVAVQWSFFVGWILYAQSKLIGIILTNHLAKTHSDVLVATSVHPGSINSELKRNFSFAFQLLWHLALYGPARGALPLLWAATIAKPSEITGQYIVSPSRHGVPIHGWDRQGLSMSCVERRAFFVFLK
uniref:Short-chain dehydrogenase/reductase family protein n=1 Tax=Mycena chlorophos TaxID=658473 RepID=A0ABQ0LFV7_MYCCL|nr:short-chain dehydrogenase/reductase family protein [Mycena chlorophos]